MRIGVVLLLVVFAAWSGIGDAGDRALRQAFYDVRGDRDTKQDVILVAIDGPTVAALGAPPWKGAELSTIAGTIAAASPRALGVVDDPARIGKLPQSVISGPVGLVYGNGTIEAVRVGDATDPTATARIAAAASVSLESRVNFIGERGLPTVSAIDVSRGAIPKQTFNGKIVVIGITAQPHAGYIPTPVGALAPAQVQAHALATAADDAAWTEVPTWMLWLVIAVSIALVLVFAHLMPRFGTLANVALALGLFALSYLLFAYAGIAFGVTLPLAAILATASVQRIYERLVLQKHIREIAQWTRRWMLLETMRDSSPGDKPGYWRRVGELARLYLGATSAIIAELPVGEHRLELRVLGNVEQNQIRERRFDVRRSPYRKAHLTLGPVWHDEYLSDGSRTLIVPLIVRNTHVIGFWMVSFERRSAVTVSHMALIKTLAQEIARALERGRAPARDEKRGFDLEIEDVKHAFQTHGQNQQDLLTLGEAMPFGVFVSTLWGDVRYANTAMKRLCSQRGIDVASADGDLAAMLSALTARGASDVHGELRALVQSRELYLRGDRDDVALSWLGREDDAERLVVGWVLPGGNPAMTPKTVDELTSTMMKRATESGIRARGTPAPARPATAPGVDEGAMTLPHQKVEDGGVQITRLGLVAYGTPTENPPRIDPSELFGVSATLVPDATFKTPKVIVADYADEEPTSVGVEPEQLPDPPRRETKRLFNVKTDT